MLSKPITCMIVMIFSCQVENIYCGKATVPHQVCERYIENQLNYTFNSTVNDTTIFKEAEFLLSLLQGQRKFINSECNDPRVSVMVTRTLHRQTENYVIIANYTISIGVKEAYRFNYSVLTDSNGEKIEDCYAEIPDILAENRGFISYFAFNISGDRFEPEHFTHDKITERDCSKEIIFCPSGADEVAKMCECSRGTYLDVNLTICTQCQQNKYQEMTGMFNCTTCQKGYSTLNKTGSRNSKACKPVDILNTTSEPTENTTAPSHEKCKKGEYLNDISNICQPCPMDQYQDEPGSTSCKKCPNDQVTSESGATELRLCMEEPGGKINVLAIALPICVVMVVIIALIIFIIFRRKMTKERERYREDFEKNFMEGLPPNKSNDVEANEYQPPKSKTTENPHYEETSDNSTDEEVADNQNSTLGHLAEDVAKRNLEIPRDCITLTRVRLGRGNFGEVQQVLVRKPDEPEMLCAAKMARGSRVPLEDMLDELDIHLKLEGKHENVVNLIGVCSSSGGPFYLIVEYCDNGSLIEYLRKHDANPEYVNTASRETLSLEWKLTRTLEICSGMKYLASHKIVHRDLAARNVLLDSDTVAKISDFGMAKDVYLKSYYTQKHEGSFPLRWMASESIKKLEFTEKTDVWSFGVLVWEIFTDGTLPYYNIIDDEKVALYILSGKKLKRPENCPKFLYNIMLKCWSNKSFNRPKFREVYDNLNQNFQHLPKQQGKTLQRRLSRDMLKKFSNTKRSLKRKMSRKSSRQSVESMEPHTSSRKPSQISLDRLSNDMESQRRHELPKNMFFNPGADIEIEAEVNSAAKKEGIDFPGQDENQNDQTLEDVEENNLEGGLGKEDSSGNRPQCSVNEETPNDSSNIKEIGLHREDLNQNTTKLENEVPEQGLDNTDGLGNIFQDSKAEETPYDSFNTRTNDNTSASKDLQKPFFDYTRENDAECNSFPETSDCSSVRTNNHSTNTVGLGVEESPKIGRNHPETSLESPSQTDDLTPKGEQCLTTDLDDLSDDLSETLGDTSADFSVDITDTLPDETFAPETINNDTLPGQNVNQIEDETGYTTTNEDKDGLNSVGLKDLDNSSDRARSEDGQKNSDGSDFLSDVLNAVNVFQNENNGVVQEQNKTEDEDTANSSSC